MHVTLYGCVYLHDQCQFQLAHVNTTHIGNIRTDVTAQSGYCLFICIVKENSTYDMIQTQHNDKYLEFSAVVTTAFINRCVTCADVSKPFKIMAPQTLYFVD